MAEHKLKGLNGKVLSLKNNDSLSTDKSVIYLDDVTDFTVATCDGLEVGSIAHVSGERGGTFELGSDTGVHDDGVNFHGWKRQYDGAVNVKWFGAVDMRKSGYSDFDSQPYLQKSFDYCHENGKNIAVTTGQYLVKDTVNTHGVTIIGKATSDVYNAECRFVGHSSLVGKAVLHIYNDTYPGRSTRVCGISITGGYIGISCGKATNTHFDDIYISDVLVGIEFNSEVGAVSDFNTINNLRVDDLASILYNVNYALDIKTATLWNGNKIQNSFLRANKASVRCLTGVAFANTYDNVNFSAPIGFLGNLGYMTTFNSPYFETLSCGILAYRGYAYIENGTYAGEKQYDSFTEFMTSGTHPRAKVAFASLSIDGNGYSINKHGVNIVGGYWQNGSSPVSTTAHYLLHTEDEAYTEWLVVTTPFVYNNDGYYMAMLPSTSAKGVVTYQDHVNKDFKQIKLGGNTIETSSSDTNTLYIKSNTGKLDFGDTRLWNNGASQLNFSPLTPSDSNYKVIIRNNLGKETFVVGTGDSVAFNKDDGTPILTLIPSSGRIFITSSSLPTSEANAATNEMWRDPSSGALYIK